jgi:hypothetical protein
MDATFLCPDTTVNTTPTAQFSMFQNASFGNVILNIYGGSEALVGK